MSGRRPQQDLKWGTTPWDGLSREALLREVHRMYFALEQSYSVIRQQRLCSPTHPFFSKNGSGGKALHLIAEILRPIRHRFSNGQVYDSFFRMASDLLFYRPVVGWVCCIKCGDCWGNSISGPPKRCCRCGAPVRPLAWKDVRPKEK